MVSPWSCLAESAAMALEMEYDDLIAELGHDGSAIVFPDLPEPGRRQAFHAQEIIDIALRRGIAVTAIEALPCSTPDGLKDYGVHFKVKRFENHLRNGRGIVTGMKRKWRHAVFWDRGIYYDPATCLFSDSKINMDIDCFYRFDEIKSSKEPSL